MIAIIDYGAGNTMSVINAINRIGAQYQLTDDGEQILSADHVIFPGVGHAGHAMSVLRDKSLVSVIRSVESPLLGICIGMQLLFEWSDEGDTECLGIIEGKVNKFDNSNIIVPLMGWSKNILTDNPLFSGVGSEAMLYSVHSYRADIGAYTISTAEYGEKYSTAVQRNNYYGVQFHPEKSSKVGQQILENFIQL